MKYKILITAPYFQRVLDEYREGLEERGLELIVPYVNERMSEEELLLIMGDVDGIICGDDQITKKVLNKARKLKVIVKWGTGIDSIDKDAAAQRGIRVRNTTNAFTEPVADTILSFILSFSRGTIDLDRKMKAGIWEKRLNKAMHEYTVGVIGVGNIGRAVIKRAETFGAKILANDIEERPYDFMVSLKKLLEESDFVVLTTDLNPTSFHLINKETIDMMKPTAYLINASRGSLIEEVALIEALKEKKIAGAALDVFEHEPLNKDHPLTKMNNVILSPHNANASEVAWKNVHENSIRQLLDDLKLL